MGRPYGIRVNTIGSGWSQPIQPASSRSSGGGPAGRQGHVVVRVVSKRHRWRKLARNDPSSARIKLKTLENGLGGRDRLDFGTVRPRVQIPGPRPISEFIDV